MIMYETQIYLLTNIGGEYTPHSIDVFRVRTGQQRHNTDNATLGLGVL